MRILLDSDHYPPFIGGAHGQTQLLGSELHRRGHDVNIATVWSGGQPAWEGDPPREVRRRAVVVSDQEASDPSQRLADGHRILGHHQEKVGQAQRRPEAAHVVATPERGRGPQAARRRDGG